MGKSAQNHYCSVERDQAGIYHKELSANMLGPSEADERPSGLALVLNRYQCKPCLSVRRPLECCLADWLRNADSVIEAQDGTLAFVKPFERLEQFDQLLDHVQREERNHRLNIISDRPVKYGQTRK